MRCCLSAVILAMICYYYGTGVSPAQSSPVQPPATSSYQPSYGPLPLQSPAVPSPCWLCPTPVSPSPLSSRILLSLSLFLSLSLSLPAYVCICCSWLPSEPREEGEEAAAAASAGGVYTSGGTSSPTNPSCPLRKSDNNTSAAAFIWSSYLQTDRQALHQTWHEHYERRVTHTHSFQLTVWLLTHIRYLHHACSQNSKCHNAS